MPAPSNLQEAKDRAREADRQPRARAVNDRIQQLLAELPYPANGETTKARIRLESLALAVRLDDGPDISSDEFEEWRELLGGIEDIV